MKKQYKLAIGLAALAVFALVVLQFSYSEEFKDKPRSFVGYKVGKGVVLCEDTTPMYGMTAIVYAGEINADSVAKELNEVMFWCQSYVKHYESENALIYIVSDSSKFHKSDIAIMASGVELSVYKADCKDCIIGYALKREGRSEVTGSFTPKYSWVGQVEPR